MATLTPDLLHQPDAYRHAAGYLSVGRIDPDDDPLLKRPLVPEDVKRMLLGHRGTTPGRNFIYGHLNRIIKNDDLDMIYISGPGHGGPAVVGNTSPEGTSSEIDPDIGQDEDGLRKPFKQFSFPGGIPSHASPECPGSIHEGDELGYSLSDAFGAVFDNPDLIVASVVGDGEAETGPLATAWHSDKFLDPATDGAVLPILYLNGYITANPRVLARIEPEELVPFFRGCGGTPYFVEGDAPALMHEALASTLDRVVEQIKDIRHKARVDADLTRPRWPMIVLRSPKGWTGPKWVDGLQIEDTFSVHQVPIAVDANHPEHLKLLEDWLKSYRPKELLPVIFAFHGYPWLIHRLTYRRTNHGNFHVRGYKEEGTITTPFDMTVLNDLDRFHLVMDAIDRLPRTGDKGIYPKQQLKDKLIEHRQYIDKHGRDMPEIRDWTWSIHA